MHDINAVGGARADELATSNLLYRLMGLSWSSVPNHNFSPRRSMGCHWLQWQVNNNKKMCENNRLSRSFAAWPPIRSLPTVGHMGKQPPQLSQLPLHLLQHTLTVLPFTLFIPQMNPQVFKTPPLPAQPPPAAEADPQTISQMPALQSWPS